MHKPTDAERNLARKLMLAYRERYPLAGRYASPPCFLCHGTGWRMGLPVGVVQRCPLGCEDAIREVEE